MKGAVVLAIKELVIEKFGNEKWQEALNRLNIKKEPIIIPGSDVDENLSMNLIHALPSVLDISLQQLFDAFAAYWVHVYSQKFYKAYYNFNKTAKDFIKYIAQIHLDSTKLLPGANPPKFIYQWESHNKLILTYQSNRNLVDLAVSLIKEVGRYYQEAISVRKINDSDIEIVFPE